jgi:hypothetical protein
MPTPEQILSGLGEIANNWRTVAIAWHVYFAAIALGLMSGARPSRRVAGILLALPLFSVSALAWVSGNPFNGTFFAASGAALVVISSGLPRDRIRIAPSWAVVAGAFMFLFGWAYPHFLETTSFLPYLYTAPTGLIPCPTLAIVTGLALVLGGLGSRAWSIVLVATAAFYGIFGAAYLGVALDWMLLPGALMIVLVAFPGAYGRPERQ